jgi:hypothetical protein
MRRAAEGRPEVAVGAGTLTGVAKRSRTVCTI